METLDITHHLCGGDETLLSSINIFIRFLCFVARFGPLRERWYSFVYT